MTKSIIELIVGDLGEKRDYRQMMKRVKALPEDYRHAFKNIQNYMYQLGGTGCDPEVFAGLIDLFECSAAEGKQVLDVIGSDASGFCDELILASDANSQPSREKLNRQIRERFYKEEEKE